MNKMSEALAEGLLNGAEIKTFQFTKEANFRVRHSHYENELRNIFKGRTNVELLEVELAIMKLEQESDRGRKGLKIDPEYEGEGGAELVECGVGFRNLCADLVLPVVWDSKRTPKNPDAIVFTPGIFSSDVAVVGDDKGPLAVCYPCLAEIREKYNTENEKIREENKKLVAEGKDPRPMLLYPRMMSVADADAAWDRKVRAVTRQRERVEKNAKRREETEEDSGKFLRRMAERAYVPKTPRGMSREQYEERKARGRRNDD